MRKTEATGENTPCKATLYVESPAAMIPPHLKNAVMNREGDVGATTGHAFIGITDKDGKETVYGFHSAAGLPENADISLGTRLKFLLSGKYDGFVGDDSKEPYDDKMVYHISQKQYDKIKAYADEQKKNPPKYQIFSGNCVLFAYKAMKQAGLKLPPQPLFHNPAAAVLGIRIYGKAQKIKQKLGQAAAKILGRFSSTRKISKDILQELKKKPSKQAFGVRAVTESLAKNAAALRKKMAGGR